MNGQKPYRPSEEDFRRYHQGEMSAQEAHAFERATLQDDFAHEASEGWEGHNPAEIADDLSQLRRQLPMSKRRTFRVWQVAASVLLLLAASFVLYWQLALPSDPIAMKESTEAPGDASTAPGTEPANEVVAEISAPEDDVQPTEPELAAPVPEPAQEQTQVAKPEPSPLRETSVPIAATRIEEVAAEPELADAEVQEDKALEEGFFADEEFAEVADEQFADVTEEAPITQDLIVLEEDTAAKNIAFGASSISEDDVAAEAAPPALAVAPTERQEPTRKARVASAPLSAVPAPLVGYPAYSEYLKDAVAEAQKEQTLQQGQVTIRAIVRSDSTLRKLEVLNGLDDATNEAALEIVRDGPPWSPASRDGKQVNSTVQIIVEFR